MKNRMRLLAVAASLASATVLGIGGASASTESPATPETPVNDLQPSSAAQSAGIMRAGEAYMGWSMRDSASSNRATTKRANSTSPKTSMPGTPTGIDVSAWNTNVDWQSQYSAGTRFAYIKATEGNYYTSATFTSQYSDAHAAGIIRGAYHFANPSVSDGASQADYFVSHGGGWSPDGGTLPGVLDIEYNPYKNANDICYGLTPAQMTNWIASFTQRYRDLTGRDAVIYTVRDWWNQCTGNTTKFNQTNPLWIAWYGQTTGTLPGGWPFYTFWQYATDPIDQDSFNGTMTQLKKLAAATPVCSAPPFPDVSTTNQFCWQINSLKSQGVASGYADGGFHPTASVSRQAFAHYLYDIQSPDHQDGPCEPSQTPTYSDVPNASQFCKSITALSQSGITNGYANGTFRPQAGISRQAIAAMIYRAYNAAVSGTTNVTDAPCTAPTPFNDVTAANKFCGDIEFMHEMNFSNGYQDGGYHPMAHTSRQAIAAFLYQYRYAISVAATTGP